LHDDEFGGQIGQKSFHGIHVAAASPRSFEQMLERVAEMYEAIEQIQGVSDLLMCI
jgi:hypothetical protein